MHPYLKTKDSFLFKPRTMIRSYNSKFYLQDGFVSHFPTGPFTISDQEVGEVYVAHERSATDFEASEL